MEGFFSIKNTMKPSLLDKSYQGAVIIQIKIDPWNEYTVTKIQQTKIGVTKI